MIRPVPGSAGSNNIETGLIKTGSTERDSNTLAVRARAFCKAHKTAITVGLTALVLAVLALSLAFLVSTTGLGGAGALTGASTGGAYASGAVVVASTWFSYKALQRLVAVCKQQIQVNSNKKVIARERKEAALKLEESLIEKGEAFSLNELRQDWSKLSDGGNVEKVVMEGVSALRQDKNQAFIIKRVWHNPHKQPVKTSTGQMRHIQHRNATEEKTVQSPYRQIVVVRGVSGNIWCFKECEMLTPQIDNFVRELKILDFHSIGKTKR